MTLRIFVNEQSVSVPLGSDVLHAVTVFDATLGESVKHGRAYITDGVGRSVEGTVKVNTGDIFRVIVSARRPPSDRTTT